MEYNYREVLASDIKNYIKENYTSIDELDRDSLYDELWIADSVTGNASGSYTFNTYQAEENIAHNWDLIEDAFNEFELDSSELGRGAEYIDVTIRCYLLGEILDDVLKELEGDSDEQ